MTLSSKRLNSEKTDEDPYYIYILIFDHYIMNKYGDQYMKLFMMIILKH